MTVRQVADAGQQLKGQHARLTEIKTIILQNLNIIEISPENLQKITIIKKVASEFAHEILLRDINEISSRID